MGELAAPFDMTFAAVSKHLRVLEGAGLVTRGREAQYRPARLDARPLAAASEWIGDYARFWERQRQRPRPVPQRPPAAPHDSRRQGEHPWLTTSRSPAPLRAPRELVFEAITKPEHFAVWFGTAAVEVPQDTLTMDVRPGGDFRAVMHLPDGNRINWSGAYVAVEPPVAPRDDPHGSARRRRRPPVLFDLEEVDGGTQLTIRQDRADFSDEQVAATIAGYNAFIDDIERVVEGLQQA